MTARNLLIFRLSRNLCDALLISVIRFYRRYLSVYKLPSCRFYPPCSQYAIESIQKKGAFKGTIKAVLRVLRCHPFSRGGYDPPH